MQEGGGQPRGLHHDVQLLQFLQLGQLEDHRELHGQRAADAGAGREGGGRQAGHPWHGKLLDYTLWRPARWLLPPCQPADSFLHASQLAVFLHASPPSLSSGSQTSATDEALLAALGPGIMYPWVPVYITVYMYTYISLYTCIHIYHCIHVYIYITVYMYTYISLYASSYATCIPVYIYHCIHGTMYICIPIHVHLYSFIPVYISTCLFICIPGSMYACFVVYYKSSVQQNYPGKYHILQQELLQ